MNRIQKLCKAIKREGIDAAVEGDDVVIAYDLTQRFAKCIVIREVRTVAKYNAWLRIFRGFIDTQTKQRGLAPHVNIDGTIIPKKDEYDNATLNDILPYVRGMISDTEKYTHNNINTVFGYGAIRMVIINSLKVITEINAFQQYVAEWLLSNISYSMLSDRDIILAAREHQFDEGKIRTFLDRVRTTIDVSTRLL